MALENAGIAPAEGRFPSSVALAGYALRVPDDDETVEGLPGRPLASGFLYEPVAQFTELHLGDEAERQVLKKIDSVDTARLRAAETSSTTYIG